MAKKYFISKQLHFGLDYLSVYGTCKFEDKFKEINFTNSNYGELGVYVYTKIRIDKYLYGITFTKDNYPVFSYVKGDETQPIPSYDCITVYGVAFKILDINEIFNFLESNFNLLRTKRFDICMDLDDSIENVLKKFNKLKQRGGTINGKGGVVETQYFGNPSKARNRRQVIRVYNKIADIRGSNKAKLYGDYLLKNNVTRVELEVRRELAQHIIYYQLFDEEILKKIFKNYLRLRTNIFTDISDEKISLYRKPKIISDEEKQGIYYKNLYKTGFNGYARNIMMTGTCPVKILIGEDIIQDSTKRELGIEIIEDLYLKEKKIKEKYLYSNKNEYEG